MDKRRRELKGLKNILQKGGKSQYPITTRQLHEGGNDMSTYVPIIVALKSGLIKSDEFVSYTPDKKRKMRLQKRAFFNDFEKETEFGLGWHPVMYKNFGVLLVSDKATEATITEFADNGISIKTLEDYANLYQNESFQSIGVALTKELLEDIPKALIHDDVWICSNVPTKRRQTPRPYNPAIPHDHRRHFGQTYCIKHMQPTIFIPPDTIVEIDNESQTGNSKRKEFKLHPRNSFNPKICLEFTDTPMWVPINEAIRARTIFDTDFVEYIPDKATVNFSKEETNAKAIQTAETEYNIGGWHPIVMRKGETYQAYLVSTHCSKFELEIPPDSYNEPFNIGIEGENQTDNGIQFLKSNPNIYRNENLEGIEGKNQFNNGIQLLNKYAKIYSCKELNVQGIPFNEELFDALNLNLKAKEDHYYLATAFANTENRRIRTKNICGESYYYHKFKLIMGLKWISYGLGKYKQSDMLIHMLPIRIAIPLPENIMVQINNSQYDGSTEKKALKLKLAIKEESSD